MFGNQLKTIIGQVIEDELVTEHGIELDALFGSRAVGARMVGSPYIMGMVNVLSRIGAKRIVQAYRGKV